MAAVPQGPTTTMCAAGSGRSGPAKLFSGRAPRLVRGWTRVL